MPRSHFSPEHELFRKQVRTFAEKELAPYVDRWEAEGLFPREVFRRAGELGIFGAPSFVTQDGELFWGDGRLGQALQWERHGALQALG